jgi:antitoxin FitA
MKVAIELSQPQVDRLREEAERLGVAPEELARAAVADLLSAQREDFRTAAAYVLRKNGELYRRLA